MSEFSIRHYFTPVVRPAPHERIGRSTLLLAAFAAIVAILLQHAAWYDILEIALHDHDSSHILLVPIVVTWLVWVRRLRLRECRIVGQWAGAVVVAAGIGAGYFGIRHGMEVFWHIGAVLTVIGCVLSVLGTQVLKAFFPVFLVLAFLVPVPATLRQDMSMPLEHICSKVSQQVLEVLGVPVSRSGNVLTVKGISVEIAEACDGLRMAIGLLLVMATFTLGTPMHRGARVLFLILSPFMAVLCNVLRLIPTVWVFGTFPHPFAQMFHDVAGWLMLPVAFVLLSLLLRLLRWAAVPVAPYGLSYG